METFLEKNIIRKFILVKGLVQGVGFRPFAYKIALENNLKGFIKNSSVGVIIDAEGDKCSIDKFVNDLKKRGPETLNIEEMIMQDKKKVNYKTFEIGESSCENQGMTFISPDLGICKECEEDIKNIKNSRYKYPFTNCTNCGPRYSIIKTLPYDRAITTMKPFEICKSCNEEYNNPESRRFHGETNCCPNCGPKLKLVDKLGNKVDTKNPMKETVRYLKEGKILSLKGIGGFHLVCNGKNQEVIELLRERKHRETKPFALMMRDIKTIKKYCFVSIEEEKIITSNKRPIVILNKRVNILPDNIAPGNRTLGVMLPYTPLHHLLFQEADLEVLIMTSANVNGFPIIYKNKEAIDKLSRIVDYHLINNREIYTSVDDSVTRFILGSERVIRRGRGYAPSYFKRESYKESLSLGPHLKNSFCFCKDGNIILSQYIGDLDNLEILDRYDKAQETLKNIYNISPELVVYDYHPDIFSKDYLNKFKGNIVGVYHHHAHIASVLFENKEKDKVIGVAYDGSGYGTDGTVWGGEFLISDCRDFKRVGHLNLVAMPGGDRAAREPGRMAISYLYNVYKDKIDELGQVFENNQAIFGYEKLNNICIEMIRKDINSPKTSSMGRFFDAVAYLLGFNKKVTFEGEAAIYLENIASKEEISSYDFDIDLVNGKYIINTDKIIIGIIKDLKEKISREVISMVFHNTIIKFTVDMCIKISENCGIKKVALSGGVFQNKILLQGIYNRLKSKGFIVYINKEVPCSDGGISLGQMVIANEREMK